MESNITSVEFAEELIKVILYYLDDDELQRIQEVFDEAKEMEKQQKIAYKISTPLGHVAHCIEKYGIEIAISEYKCKLVNNKESNFWNDCMKIAELYNEKFNKNEK